MAYKKQSIKSACCNTNGDYHQSCRCNADVSFCKTFCDGDTNCKGYVDMVGSTSSQYCEIATTSECPTVSFTSPVECTQYNGGIVGDLDEDESCGRSTSYEGCFIKSSVSIVHHQKSKLVNSMPVSC